MDPQDHPRSAVRGPDPLGPAEAAGRTDRVRARHERRHPPAVGRALRHGAREAGADLGGPQPPQDPEGPGPPRRDRGRPPAHQPGLHPAGHQRHAADRPHDRARAGGRDRPPGGDALRLLRVPVGEHGVRRDGHRADGRADGAGGGGGRAADTGLTLLLPVRRTGCPLPGGEGDLHRRADADPRLPPRRRHPALRRRSSTPTAGRWARSATATASAGCSRRRSPCSRRPRGPARSATSRSPGRRRPSRRSGSRAEMSPIVKANLEAIKAARSR
ncbi:MAG: hypothetical protein MZU95_04690 [Desulfomicrobium escambiense]|nr:hypothetical protein [Desulfomicrobium escambiense]